MSAGPCCPFWAVPLPGWMNSGVNKPPAVHWVLVTRTGVEFASLLMSSLPWDAEGQSPAAMGQVMSMSWCWLSGSCPHLRGPNQIYIHLKSKYTLTHTHTHKYTESCCASCRHGIPYGCFHALWVCTRYLSVRKSQTYSFPMYLIFSQGLLLPPSFKDR